MSINETGKQSDNYNSSRMDIVRDMYLGVAFLFAVRKIYTSFSLPWIIWKQKWIYFYYYFTISFTITIDFCVVVHLIILSKSCLFVMWCNS